MSLLRDVVILACGVSAGIHGALVPDHLAEGRGAGLGFVAAAALLGAVAVALTARPAAPHVLGAAALVFAGLLVAYALAITSGLPGLHPDAEPVDGVALATKAVETVGLAVALALLVRRKTLAVAARPVPIALTVLVALFAALTTLAVASGHAVHGHEAGAWSQSAPRTDGW